MPVHHRILIIDDDPSHLDIYSMIVRQAGYEAIPVPVRFSGPDPVPDSGIDLVLLDYRLNSIKTAPEIAQEIRSKYPEAAIVLLSDMWPVSAGGPESISASTGAVLDCAVRFNVAPRLTDRNRFNSGRMAASVPILEFALHFSLFED